MQWRSKIEKDEPGRRLVLATDFPAVPRGLLPGIAGIILLTVVGLTFGAAGLEWIQTGPSAAVFARLAFGVLYTGVTVIGFHQIGRRARTVTRFAADRSAGSIEIHEFNPLRLAAGPEVIRMADLRGLRLRAASPFEGSTAVPRNGTPVGEREIAREMTITLQLLLRGQTRNPVREVVLRVEGLDRKEEASDLALRLASVLGLGHQRVLSSDPRAIALEFSQASDGPSALAEPLTRPDYASDQVSEQADALAAPEVIEAFDPASFQSDYRIETWAPGREIRFQKQSGLLAHGARIGLALLLIVPTLVIALKSLAPGLVSSGNVATLGFAALVLLFPFAPIVLFLGVGEVLQARAVVIDWAERQIQRHFLFVRSSRDFAELRAIELQRIEVRGRRSTWYYCRLRAQLATPAADSKATPSVELVSTSSSPDPDTSYRMALPMATELAKALGLPRVVTEETH
jgi:hypothetical protein